MTERAADVSVVVLASRQGHLLHGTMLSVERAARKAQDGGLNVEVLVAAYDADRQTVTWLQERAPYRVVTMEGSCPGTARNAALDETVGLYLAFVDGGDIWSGNFLVEAVRQDRRARRDAVWRPAISIGFADDYFEGAGYSARQIPDSTDFARSSILAGNPFPSTFVARRTILDKHRFPAVDPDRGWNDVDWWWIANLLGYDIEQLTVADTLHYFRDSLARERSRARGPALLGPTVLELGKRRRCDAGC